MGFNDFDSTHADGMAEAERFLYNEFDDTGDAEIRLRAGYDTAPKQHDLQALLDPESPRFQESGSEMLKDLYRFVDNYFGETQYVDWSITGFEDLQLREEEVFVYEDGSELVVEVYEPGEEGHDVLHL